MMQRTMSTSLSTSSHLYPPQPPSPDWLFFPDTTGTPAPHARPSLTGLIRTDPCNYLAVTAVELARPPTPTRQKYTSGSKGRLGTVNSQPEDEFSFSLSFLIFLQVWSHTIPTSVSSTSSSFCCSKLVFKGIKLIHECNWNLCFAPLQKDALGSGLHKQELTTTKTAKLTSYTNQPKRER